MKLTNIEWTDASSNPIQYRDKDGRVVWGCIKKSSGCANCYAEQIALRFERGGPFTKATMEGLTPFLDEKELRHILTAKRIGGRPVAGMKCFLGDMTDVFGSWVSDELLDRLFAAMALRSEVTFQILTKRPERMREYFGGDYPHPGSKRVLAIREATAPLLSFCADRLSPYSFPLPNVWLGTSVENQAAADERIPHLLSVPAAVRFLSCEPLLGPVKLSEWVGCNCPGDYPRANGGPHNRWCPLSGDSFLPRLHWCIVGGESGPGARPMQVEWARSLVEQCKAASVPVFVKQLGARPCEYANNAEGAACPSNPKLDGIVSFNPLKLADKKGGDINEFPDGLRVREFPRVA